MRPQPGIRPVISKPGPACLSFEGIGWPHLRAPASQQSGIVIRYVGRSLKDGEVVRDTVQIREETGLQLQGVVQLDGARCFGCQHMATYNTTSISQAGKQSTSPPHQ